MKLPAEHVLAAPAEAWPDPIAITTELHSVKRFDLELLPLSLREWVDGTAKGMPCSPDYIAVGVIAALGAVIGARCAIKPKQYDNWSVVPNLWGAVVGQPSAKKSPAISAALKPLDFIIAKAKEVYEEENSEYEKGKLRRDAQQMALEKELKRAAEAEAKADVVANNEMNKISVTEPKKKPATIEEIAAKLDVLLSSKPPAPTLRRYKTNDATIEKLGEILCQNPAGILSLRDELVGLLASWERSGHEGDRTFYLESWNGCSSFDTDRIGRGSIFIPNLCLSIFGGIQPDKLRSLLELMSDALANDGTLQRFQLLVYPDPCVWEWKDQFLDHNLRDKVYGLFTAIAALDPGLWGASEADEFNKLPFFKFTPGGTRGIYPMGKNPASGKNTSGGKPIYSPASCEI